MPPPGGPGTCTARAPAPAPSARYGEPSPVATETVALNVTSMTTDSPSASRPSWVPALAATRVTDGAPASETVNTLTASLPSSATTMRPDGSTARPDMLTSLASLPPPPAAASNENARVPFCSNTCTREQPSLATAMRPDAGSTATAVGDETVPSSHALPPVFPPSPCAAAPGMSQAAACIPPPAGAPGAGKRTDSAPPPAPGRGPPWPAVFLGGVPSDVAGSEQVPNRCRSFVPSPDTTWMQLLPLSAMTILPDGAAATAEGSSTLKLILNGAWAPPAVCLKTPLPVSATAMFPSRSAATATGSGSSWWSPNDPARAPPGRNVLILYW